MNIRVDNEGNTSNIERGMGYTRQRKLLIGMLFDYTRHSTLHGLRYFTEKGLTIAEKIFWIVTFLASVACCFLLMRNVWVKWQTSPVIVTFSEKMLPISEVSFPSVTMCPQWKVDSRRYNFTEAQLKYEQYITLDVQNFTNFNESDIPAIDKFEDACLVCGLNYDAFITNQATTNASLFEHIDEMSAPFYDIFDSFIVWQQNMYLTEAMLRKVVTRDGICYNFNSLPLKKILNEESVRNDYLLQDDLTYVLNGENVYHWTEVNSDLRRGQANDFDADFSLLLKESKVHNDENCNKVFNGFKIYIHHPSELPQSSRFYFDVEPGKLNSFALKVNIINCTENLRKYDPQVRQCYFPGEKYLRYFKTYSFNNCQLEYLSNVTYQECGCVWFYMPHDKTNKICKKRQTACVRDVQDTFSNYDRCNCLQPCESIQYEAEITRTTFYPSQLNQTTLETNDIFVLEMYFKESQFVSMIRSELFSGTDFLANCGGLLGLFLGFSFLSLVEIFYFCTLKLCCTWRKTFPVFSPDSSRDEAPYCITVQNVSLPVSQGYIDKSEIHQSQRWRLPRRLPRRLRRSSRITCSADNVCTEHNNKIE